MKPVNKQFWKKVFVFYYLYLIAGLLGVRL
jgi:hypothetical protein